jgi:hypothetical protein
MFEIRGKVGQGECYHCGETITVDLSGTSPGADEPNLAATTPFEHEGLSWVRCPHCGGPNSVPKGEV